MRTPDTRSAEPAVFWWFDDALGEARRRATLTRQRFTVRGFEGLWRIAPVEAEEACS